MGLSEAEVERILRENGGLIAKIAGGDEDIMQEIRLRFFANRHRCDPQKGDARVFLSVIGRTAKMDWYRKRKKEPMLPAGIVTDNFWAEAIDIEVAAQKLPAFEWRAIQRAISGGETLRGERSVLSQARKHLRELLK